MKRLKDFTHIGRNIDLRYPTNIAICVWCVIVGCVILGIQVYSGAAPIQAVWKAALASLSVFFAWALAREIDPQEPLSAFVASTLMSIAVLIVDAQFSLLVLFYMMTILRILNRSVGLPATLFDSMLLLIFTGIVALLGAWIYAIIGLIVFLLDALLPDPKRRHLWFAALSLIIMVLAFVMQGNPVTPTLPLLTYRIVIALIGVIFIPLILKTKALNIKADVGEELLIPIRVQATQILVLFFGYWMALWQGNTGIITFLPIWLTIMGVSVFPLIKPLLPHWNLEKRKTHKAEREA